MCDIKSIYFKEGIKAIFITTFWEHLSEFSAIIEQFLSNQICVKKVAKQIIPDPQIEESEERHCMEKDIVSTAEEDRLYPCFLLHMASFSP